MSIDTVAPHIDRQAECLLTIDSGCFRFIGSRPVSKFGLAAQDRDAAACNGRADAVSGAMRHDLQQAWPPHDDTLSDIE
ncbi:hypothetical protein, partial [Staphylococcus pasteuri]|uniref:hypothetical protein n=1 Tax=Staphylococcus pasteuri TaxID=45972 RepID=UPI001E34782D